MAIGDIYRLAVEGIAGATADQTVNVFHYKQLAAPDVSPVEDLITDWIADVQGDYLACITVNFALVRYVVTQVRGGVEFTDRAVSGASGGRAGDTLPLTVSALVSWRTGQQGRSKRGRTYLPPTTETDQASGFITGGYQDDIETFATSARQVGSDGGGGFKWQLVVWSPTLEVATDVTSFVVPLILATQRRRRQGVGS